MLPINSSMPSCPPLPTPSSGNRQAALDLRGEVCPYTFVRTRLALEALPLGASLAIVVDYEPARRNVPRSAAEWGQEVVEVVEITPVCWRITLIKRVE
jgi:TusA-related sulfurtransferase